ncbi:MAG: hypothetical protein WAU45_02105 [Blastocatellia bacterium]
MNGFSRRVVVSVNLVVLATTLVVAGVTKWMTGGWFMMLVGVFLYPSVLVAHAAIHLANLLGRGERTHFPMRVLMSHAALLAGFLAQYDAGDAPGFFSLERLLGWDAENLDNWSMDAMTVYNAVVFLPVVFSWIYLLASRQSTLRPRL